MRFNRSKILESVDINHGLPSKKPKEQSEFEQMLKLLDLSTLEAIDIKCRQDTYTYGKQPLLTYSEEGITTYASAIFEYVLPQIAITDLSKDEYITQWVSPYTKINEWLNSKYNDFIYILQDVVENPESTPEPASEERCLYTKISDFLDGKDTFYTDLIDFMLNTFSPLRQEEVHDTRILAMINEIDDMREKCNAELYSFIGRKYPYTEKTEKIEGSNGTEKIPYRLNNSRTVYGAELKRLRKAVIEHFEFSENIPSKTINAIKKGSLSSSQTAYNAQAIRSEPLISAEDYINQFSDLLSPAYAKIKSEHLNVHKDPIACTVEDIYAQIDAIHLAKEQGIPIETVQARQLQAQNYFYEYNNFRYVLSACLKLILNNIAPESVMTPEALSHGAVQGMLSFVDSIKSSIKRRILTLNYEQLAHDLYHEIHLHTKGFANALPLPEVLLLDAPISVTSEYTDNLPATVKVSSFDLTPVIQDILTTLDADAVVTYTEILSEAPDPTSLVPVTDPILKNIAQMIAGHGTMPYLLDGNLILQSGKRFYKVIPIIRDDGYADYVFVACNYNTLTGRIYELQKLLKTSVNYQCDYPDEEDYKYIPLPNALAERQATIQAAHEQAELLLDRANRYFPPDIAEKEAAYIKSIANIHYYSQPMYLSAHRLAAWVYYPVEYTYYISSKPMDDEGKRLLYEPNHINLNRADNRKENLKIEFKKTNAGLRSSSRPVTYAGLSYLTLKDYCEKTGAGNYATLSRHLSDMQQGDTKEYGTRIYTLSTDSRLLIVTDKSTDYIYKGEHYKDLKTFAKAAKLDYTNIQRKLLREKKAGTKEFKYKTLKFLLLDNGSVQIS